MAITIDRIDGNLPAGNPPVFDLYGLGAWTVTGTISKPEGDIVLTMEWIAASDGKGISIPPGAEDPAVTDPVDYEFSIGKGEFTENNGLYTLSVSASTENSGSMEATAQIRWQEEQPGPPVVVARAAAR